MGHIGDRRCCLAQPGPRLLLALAVEIVIVVLQDAGALKFVALAAAGAVSWSWCDKLWVRLRQEGQGRDLSGALRPRGWRGLRELIRGALHYGET